MDKSKDRVASDGNAAADASVTIESAFSLEVASRLKKPILRETDVQGPAHDEVVDSVSSSEEILMRLPLPIRDCVGVMKKAIET